MTSKFIASFLLFVICFACLADPINDKPKTASIENFADFPVGVWQASIPTNITRWPKGGSNKAVEMVLHVHSIPAIWASLVSKGTNICIGQVRESDLYSDNLGFFSDCLNTDYWLFEQLSATQIEVKVPSGQKLTFNKGKPKQKNINLNRLSGVWLASTPEDANSSLLLNVDDDFGVRANFEFLDASLVRLFKDEAGILMLAGYDGAFYEFLPINFVSHKKFSFVGDPSTTTFKKTRQRMPSSLIVDDYGRPMQIDTLRVSVNVLGDVAETTVELAFTNIVPDTDEAQFALPLPSSAVVSAYWLDVFGELVPGVSIPKDQADDIFETLQNRGIDPGLAKMSEANQFTTEVYPINYGEQRRIKVTYVEPLSNHASKGDKNTVTYSFPLEAFGQANEVFIDLAVDSNKRPKTKRLKQHGSRKRLATHWQTQTTGYSATVYERDVDFSSPLTLLFEVPETSGMVLENFDGETYFSVSGKVEVNSDSVVNTDGPIDIAWDVSASMAAHHANYVTLVAELKKQYPQKAIHIYPFHIEAEPLLILPAGIKFKVLKAQLNSLFYDGAADIGLLNNWPKVNDALALVFTDGIHTAGNKLHLNNNVPAWTIYPANNPVNLPLLADISGQKGALPIGQQGRSLRGQVRAMVNQLSQSVPKVMANCLQWQSPCLIQQPSVANPQYRIVGNYSRTTPALFFNIGTTQQALSLHTIPKYTSKLGEYLWAKQQLAPLLAAPRDHQDAITEIGLRHGLSTPYTTLIVLEDVRDYAEFGVTPPTVMDPKTQYSRLRDQYLLDEKGEQQERYNQLISAWEDRLYWYKEGKPKKRRGWYWNGESQGCEEGDDPCPVEEVIVMGIKASSSPNVYLEPWQPDTPYMRSLNAQPLAHWVATYQEQRLEHQHSMPFYMDISKFLFDKGLKAEGQRVLSNILELFPQKPRMERLVAYVLQEAGEQAAAQSLFEHLNEIAPYQASSKRDLALIYERIGLQQGDEAKVRAAIKLFYEAAVNSHDDPDELPVTTIMEMNNLIKRAKLDPHSLNDIDQRLLGDICLDLRITLAWTNEFSMVDLYVTEPSGEVVEWKDRVSKIGAWLPYDSWGNGPVEYLLKKAVAGEYKVKAVYWSDDDIEGFSPIGVKVDFYLNYGQPNEKVVTSVIRLENVDEEYVVGKVSLPDSMVGGLCQKRH